MDKHRLFPWLNVAFIMLLAVFALALMQPDIVNAATTTCSSTVLTVSASLVAINAPNMTDLGWVLDIFFLLGIPAIFLFVGEVFDIGVDVLTMLMMFGLALGTLFSAIAATLPWGGIVVLSFVIALYFWKNHG
jgi:hypothetical protein